MIRASEAWKLWNLPHHSHHHYQPQRKKRKGRVTPKGALVHEGICCLLLSSLSVERERERDRMVKGRQEWWWLLLNSIETWIDLYFFMFGPQKNFEDGRSWWAGSECGIIHDRRRNHVSVDAWPALNGGTECVVLQPRSGRTLIHGSFANHADRHSQSPAPQLVPLTHDDHLPSDKRQEGIIEDWVNHLQRFDGSESNDLQLLPAPQLWSCTSFIPPQLIYPNPVSLFTVRSTPSCLISHLCFQTSLYITKRWSRVWWASWSWYREEETPWRNAAFSTSYLC